MAERCPWLRASPPIACWAVSTHNRAIDTLKHHQGFGFRATHSPRSGAGSAPGVACAILPVLLANDPITAREFHYDKLALEIVNEDENAATL